MDNRAIVEQYENGYIIEQKRLLGYKRYVFVSFEKTVEHLRDYFRERNRMTETPCAAENKT